MVAESTPPTEWFDRWWSPAEFFPMVQRHNEAIASYEFIARPEFQPLREAYAAGFFSWILAQTKPTLVKLNADRFPDFSLRFHEAVVGFELVEADRPGRRRTEEYRNAARREAAGLPPHLEVFDPFAEQEAAIPAIQSAVEKKAAKKYKPAPHLLVYVNLWLFDKPPLTPVQFADLLREWRDSLPEVWLLWGGNAIQCWPDPVHLVGVPPQLQP